MQREVIIHSISSSSLLAESRATGRQAGSGGTTGPAKEAKVPHEGSANKRKIEKASRKKDEMGKRKRKGKGGEKRRPKHGRGQGQVKSGKKK